MKTLKYTYLRVIQQSTGQGWEDVSEYAANSAYKPLEKSDKPTIVRGREVFKSLLSQDLKEYQLTGYPTRVISRKVKN